MKHSSNRASRTSLNGHADGRTLAVRRRGPEGRIGAGSGDEGWQGSAACERCGRLTSRERWIVSQLMKHRGAPNKVIASALHISPNTLRNHLASIYGKLGVRRRVELVLYAMEHGLDGSSHA